MPVATGNAYSVASGLTIHAGRVNAVAGTGVAVNNFTADRIFQRAAGSNAKTVTITGAYTGSPTLIEARVVNFVTGDQITPWATLATSPTGGTFSGSHSVPVGPHKRWYRLQVRDGVNTALTAAGTTKFAVGLGVLDIGQSNRVHLSDTNVSYPLASQGVRRFLSSAYGFVGNHDDTNTFPENTVSATYGATYTAGGALRGDGAVFYANYLAIALDMPVCLLDYAVGGTAISRWQPVGGDLYATAMAAVAAFGGDVELVNWYQGEDNANLATSSASYQASLLNILNGVKAQTGRSSSQLGFGVVTLGTTLSYGAEGTFGVIRSAQVDFVAANAGSYLLGVAMDQPLGDASVHLSAAGQGVMGKRYAKASAAHLGGTDKPGPRIASATHSGAVVTFTITGGTGALVDGGGGAGAALLGFRIYNDGVAGTISSTAIVGSNVVITMSAALTGTVTADFGMANAPFTMTPAAASVLYDSDTVPGHTLGLPLQPRALFAVS